MYFSISIRSYNGDLLFFFNAKGYLVNIGLIIVYILVQDIKFLNLLLQNGILYLCICMDTYAIAFGLFIRILFNENTKENMIKIERFQKHFRLPKIAFKIEQ